MTGFVDIHHHILPGLDDGPRTEQDAEEMLNAAEKEGIAALVATPHIYPGRARFDETNYHDALRWARKKCESRHPGLRILAGAEVHYTEATPRFLAERRIPTLADTRYVLIEFLPDVDVRFATTATEQVLSAGYWPVLAHVERYPKLLRHPNQLAAIKSLGEVRLQMNAQSLLRSPIHTLSCHRLLRARLIDYIATDAHNTTSRRAALTACADHLLARYGDYARRLLIDNPSALIESRAFQ